MLQTWKPVPIPFAVMAYTYRSITEVAGTPASQPPPANDAITPPGAGVGDGVGVGLGEGLVLGEGVGEGVGGTQAELPLGATTRTRPYTSSVTNSRPKKSTATPQGVYSKAAAARPPSPADPGQGARTPAVPMTTPEKVPFCHTFRTRLLFASAANSEPQASTAMPRTPFTSTEDARAPGRPMEPATPVPSKVEMFSVLMLMARTRCSSVT